MVRNFWVSWANCRLAVDGREATFYRWGPGLWHTVGTRRWTGALPQMRTLRALFGVDPSEAHIAAFREAIDLALSASKCEHCGAPGPHCAGGHRDIVGVLFSCSVCDRFTRKTGAELDQKKAS